MLDWCAREVLAGAWAYHGWSEPRGRGVVPRDFAGFYFLDRKMAEAFRVEFGGELSERPAEPKP